MARALWSPMSLKLLFVCDARIVCAAMSSTALCSSGSSSSASSRLQAQLTRTLHHLRNNGFHSIDLRSVRSSLTEVYSSATGLRKIMFDTAGAPTIEGDIRNKMGKRKFDQIADSPNIKLHNIHYCVQGLSWLQQSMRAPELIRASISENEPDVDAEKRARAILNHAYLVIEMKDARGESWYIQAEKLGAPKEEVGILINEKEGFDDDERNEACAFTILVGAPITAREIVAVLEASDPNYCLNASCCWDYARDTAKSLLNACIYKPGVSPDENRRLLEELEKVVESSVKNVMVVVNSFRHRVTDALTNRIAR